MRHEKAATFAHLLSFPPTAVGGNWHKLAVFEPAASSPDSLHLQLPGTNVKLILCSHTYGTEGRMGYGTSANITVFFDIFWGFIIIVFDLFQIMTQHN